jgi:hypothetical protein
MVSSILYKRISLRFQVNFAFGVSEYTAKCVDIVQMISSIPRLTPDTPTARLNVRLRRYTTVLIAHDHMEFGTDMLCTSTKALSMSVRHGRYALPST